MRGQGYPTAYRPSSGPQQRWSGQSPRNTGAAIAATARSAGAAGALPAGYGDRWLRRPFQFPTPNQRVPALAWLGAFFNAYQIGLELGNWAYEQFKGRMVSSLLVQYDYVQTSACGIPWDYISDVYDYPACGPSFTVPATPFGLSTSRPAAVTMWGPITGYFAGHPERQGSEKWMRTVALGPSITGFMPQALPRPLTRPSVPAVGIFPGVLDWSEPIAVPLSLVAGLPVIPGVREVGNAVGSPPHIGLVPRDIVLDISGPVGGSTTVTRPGAGFRPISRPIAQVRPAFWERERKLLDRTRAGRAAIATFRLLDLLGSLNGAVRALWYALPKWSRTEGAGPTQRWLDVVNNVDRIIFEKALKNAAVFAAYEFLGGVSQNAAREMTLGLFGEQFGWGVYRAGTTALGSTQRLGRLAQRDAREDVRGD